MSQIVLSARTVLLTSYVVNCFIPPSLLPFFSLVVAVT